MGNKHNRSNRGGNGRSGASDFSELNILIRGAGSDKPEQRFGKSGATPPRKPPTTAAIAASVTASPQVLHAVVADDVSVGGAEHTIEIPVMDSNVRHNAPASTAEPATPAPNHMVAYWQLLNDTEAFLGRSL